MKYLLSRRWLAAGIAIFGTGFAQMASADIILSEVMTNNVTTLLDEDGESPDWIELHNDGDAAVDLGGYFLTDDDDDLNKWVLPAVELAADGYLIIFASGKDRGGAGTELHANFQLKNGGEFLALVNPDKTTILDQFAPEIPQLSEDESYGVRASGDLWVLNFFSSPTPNEANGSGKVAEAVEFAISGQAFTDTLEVALSTRSGSKISYTTDGNKPTLFNGSTYTEPIELTESTILSAQISGGPLTQEVFFQVTPELASISSNLPLVIVQSPGTIGTTYDDMLLAIKRPSGEDSRTRFHANEPFSLTGSGQIRTRGSSTQSFPKKSYRLEFQDEDGEDKVKKPLGMPSESDWILSGRYGDDRALIRNEFTYQLSRDIGRYAARTRFCEVYVNDGNGPVSVDDYVGVYSFMEAMKRDADRIDIAELAEDQNAEPEVTGGYIFKVDRGGPPNDTRTTGGGQSIVITDPPASELTDAQQDYLEDYLDDMRDSLDSADPETGYPAFIDVPSWIDHHMINMLMLNVDSLRLSTFFFKERNGKVFGGPVWDFNISSGSDDRFGNPPRASQPETWRGISGDRGTSFFENQTQRWWGDLFGNREFQQQYCDRWHELRVDAFSNEYIITLINSMADEIREAQGRNEERWPGAPPEHGGWQGEIDRLKDWLTTRADWVDKEFVRPPGVTPNGGALAADGTIRLKANRGTLFSPTDLYYTTDGTDPRLAGGEISATAIKYDGVFTLNASANLVVREYLPSYKPKSDGPDQQWSAPANVQFVIGSEPAAAGNLVVSEIMYHPESVPMVNDDDYEFLEFTNIGTAPIDLLGVTANDGIRYTQTEPLILSPGASAVLVRNLEAFRERYGDAIVVAGVYEGALANSGDQVGFEGATGEAIVAIDYNDNAPWPTEADGDGFSLELIGFKGNPDPNMASNWAISSEVRGTPGKTDGGDPPVGQTYEEWAPATITDGSPAGKTDDPDGDGFVNLAEFALGTDPVVAHDREPFTVSADAAGVSVSYSIATGIIGVTITLQTSADLATWVDFAGQIETVADEVTAQLTDAAQDHVRLKFQ